MNKANEIGEFSEYFEFQPLPQGFRSRKCDACGTKATHYSVAAWKASNRQHGFVCEEHSKTIPAILEAFVELSEG